MVFEILESKSGPFNRVFCYGGYTYTLNRMYKNTLFLKCRKKGCGSVARWFQKSKEVVISRPHNHPFVHEEIQFMRLYAEMKRRVVFDHENPKEIYHKYASKYPFITNFTGGFKPFSCVINRLRRLEPDELERFLTKLPIQCVDNDSTPEKNVKTANEESPAEEITIEETTYANMKQETESNFDDENTSERVTRRRCPRTPRKVSSSAPGSIKNRETTEGMQSPQRSSAQIKNIKRVAASTPIIQSRPSKNTPYSNTIESDLEQDEYTMEERLDSDYEITEEERNAEDKFYRNDRKMRTSNTFDSTKVYEHLQEEQLKKMDVELTHLKNVVARIESVSKNLSSTTSRDSDEEFTKYINSLLRDLPQDVVISIKQQILSIIFQAKLVQEQNKSNTVPTAQILMIPQNFASQIIANPVTSNTPVPSGIVNQPVIPNIESTFSLFTPNMVSSSPNVLAAISNNNFVNSSPASGSVVTVPQGQKVVFSQTPKIPQVSIVPKVLPTNSNNGLISSVQKSDALSNMTTVRKQNNISRCSVEVQDSLPTKKIKVDTDISTESCENTPECKVSDESPTNRDDDEPSSQVDDLPPAQDEDDTTPSTQDDNQKSDEGDNTSTNQGDAQPSNQDDDQPTSQVIEFETVYCNTTNPEESTSEQAVEEER